MKPKSNRFLALAAIASALATHTASATIYAWDGGAATTNWTDANNWNPNGTQAPLGVSAAHRLNISSTQKVIYNDSGTTNYTGDPTPSTGGGRGLVIGSGTSARGEMEITAGTFSTNGTAAADVIGNGSGSIATLTINGGNFIGSASTSSPPNIGTGLGIGGGPNCTLNVLNGTATLTTLSLNNTTGTINLNGNTEAMGTLALNTITRSGGTNTINLNGGTLKARVASTTFIGNLASTTILVKSGGAIIDTSGDATTGVDVTIALPMLEDPSSTGGGLIKKGNGLLTLGAPSTITGDVTIEAGGLGVKADATAWMPLAFTHTGDTLNFDLGVYNPANPPVINVASLALNTTDITVNIAGSSIPVSSEIKIFEYGTKSGTGSLKLNIASLPVNMVAELKENVADGYYYLNVTSPSATTFTWSGATATPGTGDWDTTSSNWNLPAVPYSEPALVVFPNITTGGTVTLTADVAPITLDINNATGNPYTFAGAGKITGSTGITKAGTGIANFNGAAHTYSGAVAINAGAVIKKVADSTTGGITVANNATFVLDGGVTTGAGQTLTLSGPGATGADYFYPGSALQRGALQAQNGANTWNGDVVITTTSNTRIGVQNGASLTIDGTITESAAGASPTFRAGAVDENITLNGVCFWSGDTIIYSTGGSIKLGGNDRLPTGSRVKFTSSAAVLDLNGHNQQVLGISDYNPTVTNGGASPSVLTLSPLTPTSIGFYGVIVDGTGTISLVKSGDGTIVLGGNNTYTGTTKINIGRLEISENQSATGDVIINGGSLKLSNVKTLASGVNMSIASGAFFYLDGSSQTLGKLEGAGTIDHTYNAVGVDTLSVGANDAISTFGGVIQQSQPRTYALTKIGTGTFTLTGLNTYTGNTTVEDGMLSVAQSNFADTSTVTIGSAEASAAVLHLPIAGTDIVTALIIDGVSQPGDGAVYDKDNSGGAITGNGKIQVGTAPAGGFTSWVATNGVLEGENGDDDKDGIINLVEYALGLDPKASSHPVGTLTGYTLKFIKGPEAKAADDVTYIIETSTTLEAGSWTPAAATDTEDDISYLLPSTVVGGRIFGRLKVTKP